MPTVTDNFTVDNLATNYAVQTSEWAGGVSGGVFNYTGAYPTGYRRTAETYLSDHSSQATFKPAPAAVWDIAVRIRCSATSRQYYAGGVAPNDFGHNRYAIWKYTAGTYGVVAVHSTQVGLANDVVKLAAVGATLSLSVNGTVILTATDSDFSGGSPGWGGGAPTSPLAFIDDWTGDDGTSGGGGGGTKSDNFSADTITSGDWVAQTSELAGDISGGAWRITSASACGIRRVKETYTGDHFSQATVQPVTGIYDQEVRVRCQAGARTYYAAGCDPNDFGGTLYRIWKLVGTPSWAWTLLASHASQNMASGDVVRLTVSGSTLTLRVNGTDILSANDTTLTGGAPGLGGAASTSPQGAWDNWSGDDVAGTGGGPSGAPNPLLLPAAITSQHPLLTAYDALNVPAIVAGGTYFDPTTGVKVYKLTSAVFPLANTLGLSHDYAEGGAELSLPHTGTTRTAIVRNRDTLAWWALDFTPGVGVSNPRILPTALQPNIDIAFAFSQNTATPYHCYVGTADAVKKFDVRTMTEVVGSGFPIAEPASYPCWLQLSKNDEFLVYMLGANGPNVVGYDTASQTRKMGVGGPGGMFGTFTVNEPRVDRAGRYIAYAIGTGSGTPGDPTVVFWDFNTATFTWVAPRLPPNNAGGTGIPFGHVASLCRRFAGVQWDGSYPPPYWELDPSVPNSQVVLSGGTCSGIPLHCNGNWVQPTVGVDDQWYLMSQYGSLESAPPFDTVAWLFPGGILLSTSNGQRRALVHPYSVSNDYWRLTFAKFSTDGAYVMFNSDMHGTGRTDVFIAEVPTTLDTTPPSAPGTPSASAISSSQVNVTWGTATDDVGVTGYFVERQIGAGAFAVLAGMPINVLTFSDTTVSASTTYGYRIRARDAAGNLGAYSSTATVTTPAPSGDTTPPTAPGTLSATATSGSTVNVGWGAATDNIAVTGYYLERDSVELPGMPITVLTYNDTGLTPGSTHAYRVRARDAAGNRGPYSNTVSVVLPITADTTPPTNPGSIQASSGSSTTMSLWWYGSTDNVAVTGYSLERAMGAGSTAFAPVSGMPQTGTAYNDAGLLPSTLYRYRVRATDAAGNWSGYSPITDATTQPATDSTPPTAPGPLTAVAMSSAQVNLNWGAATDNVAVTGYFIERNSVELPGMPMNVLSYSDFGLSPSTPYTYRVRAVDGAGNRGPYGNNASATTAPIAPGGGATQVWPTSLPSVFQAQPGAVETAPDMMLETQMDAGPPKARRRFTAAPRPVTGTLVLTQAQRATLDSFYVNTLQGGVLPFEWTHPMTGAIVVYRFVKQNGLKYRMDQPAGVNLIYADLQLRIMP
jgi:chitodextrinase